MQKKILDIILFLTFLKYLQDSTMQSYKEELKEYYVMLDS